MKRVPWNRDALLASVCLPLALAACRSEPPAADPAVLALDRARLEDGRRAVEELIAGGEIDRAVRVAEAIEEIDPYAAESHLAVSEAQAARAVRDLEPRAYDEAVRRATFACEAAPRSADAFYARGKLQFDRRHFSRADVDFRRALEIDPRHADALRMNAWTARALGRPRAERAAWEALVAARPDDGRAAYRLGEFLTRSEAGEDVAAGRTWIERSVELAPSDPLLLQGLARLRADEQRYTDAEALLRRAVDAAAGDSIREADALFNLGAAIQAQGRLAAAREIYEQCLAANLDDHRARGNLGFVLLEMGEKAEGRRLLREALAKEESARVRDRIEALLSKSEADDASDDDSPDDDASSPIEVMP